MYELDKLEIRNAKINKASLTTADHGILCFWLDLSYGSAEGQGFGGIALDGAYDKERKERLPHAFAGHCIRKIMEAVGVEKWEDLNGKHCRVLREPGWSGLVRGVGPIIGDANDVKWFIPANDYEKYYEPKAR